jgi:hypothetical protein
MIGMVTATWAEFFDREFFRLALLVLAGGVIAPFAGVALKADQISHCSLPPRESAPRLKIIEAHDGNRTHDLFLTKEVLYRLSYVGVFASPCCPGRGRLERETGLEPATPSLEGSRSTN